MQEQSFQHIIFDLGGVIINLDMQRTFKTLADLAGITEKELLDRSYDTYDAFERGLVSEEAFRDLIRGQLKLSIDNEAFDRAWNQMLLDLPFERLRKLEDLGRKYNLYLLSNTNSIHIRRLNEILSSVNGKKDIAEYFKRVHYSHLMNMRKPDHEIFKKVMEINNLPHNQTVFIDDTYDNVVAAEQLGIQTYHVTSDIGMMDYFDDL